MPAGFERINAKRSQPNSRIVFIKPLPGPDEAIAKDFLERIAAQCFPIMRDYGIYVTSLEQYEFNREFVGRNFNAGEVVQLVLKARSGHWLPFDYVQMVMMHELAHCKQMNHSKAFWAVRNSYAEQMRKLWVKGYTGEGLWGRGSLLSTGEFEKNTVKPDEPLPEHLCGGTYASRKRRRKHEASGSGSQKPTAEERKEQKEKRILKKFGPGGKPLGATMLENRKGKAVKTSKPRVAGSNRGRELRAAAALARFEQVKKEEEKPKVEVLSEDDDETASEPESDGDNDDVIIVDVNGNKLVDGKGRGMVRVCGDENKDDQDSRDELKELQRFRSFGLQRMSVSAGGNASSSSPAALALSPKTTEQSTFNTANIKKEPRAASGNVATRTSVNGLVDDRKQTANISGSSNSLSGKKVTIADRLAARPAPSSFSSSIVRSIPESKAPKRPAETTGRPPSTDGAVDHATGTINRDKPAPPSDTSLSNTDAGTNDCPVCSFVNDDFSVTCGMCSHVLRPSLVPGTWRCRAAACTAQGSKYLNAGDYGACGVCGAKNPDGVGTGVMNLTG